MKVAICIGHNSRHKGAFSLYLNATEFDYNTRIARLVKGQLNDHVEVFNRYYAWGYNKEIQNLADRVNRKVFDLVVELHFNAAAPSAEGYEALYFHTSKKGKEYAKSFCEAMGNEYGGINRGAKPLSKDTDRGFLFVQKMKAPAIILEPFFGSNKEATKFINAQRYADTLVSWLKKEFNVPT